MVLHCGAGVRRVQGEFGVLTRRYSLVFPWYGCGFGHYWCPVVPLLFSPAIGAFPRRSFANLQCFPSLQTLVLDKNDLQDVRGCPTIPTLTTLWLNNNRVSAPGTFSAIDVMQGNANFAAYWLVIHFPCRTSSPHSARSFAFPFILQRTPRVLSLLLPEKACTVPCVITPRSSRPRPRW